MSFSLRPYQEEIVSAAKQHNTLVVLPTGLGKTAIAISLTEHRLSVYPDSKVLILAPTKPLVEQHFSSFSQVLPDAETLGVVLTGQITPKKRSELFAQSSIIFSTPQTIENDLLAGRISLSDVSLLVLDEAHRATGDYAYVGIARVYAQSALNQRILSLTASPGSKKEIIDSIVSNCFVEKVEVRSSDHPSIKPFIQELDITHVEVSLPDELLVVSKALSRFIQRKVKQLLALGIIKNPPSNKGQFLMAQKELQHHLSSGEVDPAVWSSLSVLAEILKVSHALELLESQGVASLQAYIAQMDRQAQKGQSKAVVSVMKDPDFIFVVKQIELLSARGLEHPKLIKLLSILKVERLRRPNSKIIVFNQYRDMASEIVSRLGSSARLFVGQQKKGETGLSQKEQKAMLDSFRSGDFPILVATAVGEEGLDIPAVDLVVFYEPVPSAIRTIQRRGRTGRHSTGRVLVLVARDTRDVAYRFVAASKEKRMYRLLEQVGSSLVPSSQKTLLDVSQKKSSLRILADAREKSSGVLKSLREKGVDLVLESLPVGDYHLSSRVVVELKRERDFVDSLLDGRLFDQLSSLSQFQKPLLIVQGSNWYSQRQVHPNAIRGALASIAISFGVPMLVSQSDDDTAELLLTLAKREQDAKISSPKSSGVKMGGSSLVDVVSTIPSVGPIMAPRLLDRFGSLKELVCASAEDLTSVEGVGKKKAEAIVSFFDERFTK